MKTSSTGHQQVKLSDVVERHTERYDDPAKHGLSRYVKVEHFDLDNLRLSRWGQADDGQLPPTFKFVFRSGMLLYPSRSPNLRQYASPDFDGICGEKTFVIKSKDPEVLLPELVPFLFSTDSLYRHCNGVAVGSVNAHVRWRDLASFEFALPPLEEQRRFVEVLQACNSVTETAHFGAATAHQTLLAYREEFFKALTVAGTPIQDVTHLVSKGSSPKWQGFDYQSEGLRFITSENVRDEELDLEPQKFLPFEFSDKFKGGSIEPGDLLINLVGASIGRMALAPEGLGLTATNQAVARVRVKKDLLIPEFALSFLMTPSVNHKLCGKSVDGARPNLSLTALRETLIPIPSMDVQLEHCFLVSQMKAACTSFRERGSMANRLGGNILQRIGEER